MVAAAYLDKDILPSLIKYFLDIGRNVDDIFGGDHVVVTMDISVVHLIKPESIRQFSTFVYFYFRSMLD